MPSKATVRAPSNIAFIKYWGARNLERAVPLNASISMTLERCYSRSTVEALAGPGEDTIHWRGVGGGLETAPPDFAGRVRRHLDVLRRWAGAHVHFRVATENSFPPAAGIASSASGFAALTLAAVRALDRRPAPRELSSLARQSGSGSAARSVFGGYVEWPAAPDDEACAATQLAPATHWDLRDVVAVVEHGPKATSSLEGHRRARTSPYFATRLAALPARLDEVRRAIAARDLERLGDVVELEAIDLHVMAMTSRPPIFYWKPGTLAVLDEVRAMRKEGLAAYATMDAGANVHVLCPPEAEPQVAEWLAELDAVEAVLRDRVGEGPVAESEHLL